MFHLPRSRLELRHCQSSAVKATFRSPRPLPYTSPNTSSLTSRSSFSTRLRINSTEQHGPNQTTLHSLPNPSVDVLTSVTASLDLNRIDSPHAVSLSHSSSEANTKISKRVRWADGINEQIQRTPEINDGIRRRYRERRASTRHVRLPTRLQAHLRAERTAVRTQRYLIRQRTKVLKAGLHNSSGDEVIFEGSEDHRYPRLIRKNDKRRRTRMHFNQFRRQLSDLGPALSAVRQALSENARNRTPPQMPEDHLDHTDVFTPSNIVNWWRRGL